MPTLTFGMEDSDGKDVTIELKGENYTWDYQNGDVNCHLMVAEYSGDSVVLGNIFLTNFVTTFDMGANTIQL